MEKIKELEKHKKDYKKDAWEDYSEIELLWWISLLKKRADMRTNPEKKVKDLYDASNYQLMLDKLRNE